MPRWAEFAASAPELAERGLARLEGDDGVAIGFLATVGPNGQPSLAPVCPIFCDGGLYLSTGAHTPKAAHLARDGRYVLHAFLGANDEEFQISGTARLVTDDVERSAVHVAIPFPSFKAADPVFELLVDRCLWCWWDNPGAQTRPAKVRWRAPGA